jgi:hypothetical protein
LETAGCWKLALLMGINPPLPTCKDTPAGWSTHPAPPTCQPTPPRPICAGTRRRSLPGGRPDLPCSRSPFAGSRRRPLDSRSGEVVRGDPSLATRPPPATRGAQVSRRALQFHHSFPTSTFPSSRWLLCSTRNALQGYSPTPIGSANALQRWRRQYSPSTPA